VPVKRLRILGIVLIVAGALALFYQHKHISYKTDEQTVQIGPMHAKVETTKTIPLPAVLGGMVLAGGTLLVIYGGKKP